MEKLSPLRFDALAGYARTPFTLITADEREWFSEEQEKVLGVIVQDRADQDYVCVVMGRDRVGRYRAVHSWFGIDLCEWPGLDPGQVRYCLPNGSERLLPWTVGRQW
jgi:hypothetical protein